MKTMIKKVSAVAAAAVLAMSSAAFSVSAAESASLKNDSIEVYADSNTTKFCMFNSNHDELLYNCTSRAIASVDGSATVIGGTEVDVNEQTKTISVSGEIDKVLFSRTLRIVANTVTGKEDTLEVAVSATNTDSDTHSVGSRILLDTKLGENDDAPFRVTGYGPVTTNTQFEGSSVPASFNTFDDLASPKIVTAGTFPTGSAKPDIVQFNNWFYASETELVAPIKIGSTMGDSSVSGIWNERQLAPGESFSCRMYYGLSHVDVSSASELVLGANKSTGEFTINEEGTGYNTVSILSYLQNAGIVNLNNVEISLSLPNGVSTTDGNTKKTYSSMDADNAVHQDTWVLQAEPSGAERNISVLVKAKSNETGEITPVTLTFTIPAIEGAPVIEETTTEPTTTEEPTTVPGADDQKATSATKPVKKSTPGEATPGEATDSQATASQPIDSNGAIQTGAALPAVIILAVLISAAGAVYIGKKRTGIN